MEPKDSFGQIIASYELGVVSIKARQCDDQSKQPIRRDAMSKTPAVLGGGGCTGTLLGYGSPLTGLPVWMLSVYFTLA
jgi:hypothetical protein